MAVKRSSAATAPGWSPESEVALMSIILEGGHKPAGIAKHFQITLVHDKMVQAGHKDLTVASIWQYLESLYNLSLVDSLEMPSSSGGDDQEDVNEESDDEKNEAGEEEFSLPRKEFQGVVAEMKSRGLIDPEAQLAASAPAASNAAKEDQPQKQQPASSSKDSSASTRTPKAAGGKRPTRSTPGSTAKRRK